LVKFKIAKPFTPHTILDYYGSGIYFYLLTMYFIRNNKLNFTKAYSNIFRLTLTIYSLAIVLLFLKYKNGVVPGFKSWYDCYKCRLAISIPV